MKNYKNFRVMKEASADDYVPEVDDIDDIADGEQEFVDLHTAMTMSHPVAGDDQFKSNKSPSERKDAKGEDTPIKSGTTGDTKFAQFRDKIGKTPTRKGDKSQGDMKAETVKEEVELDEANVRARYDNQKGVIEIHSKDYAKLPKAYKGSNPKKPTMLMMTKKGTSLVPVRFTDDDISFEEVELDEAQKLFMFKTKPEADKKAKEIKGKVISLGPKNFAVVTMDLTVVKEEVELDEAVKAGMMKLKDGKSIKVSPDEAKMFNDVMKELNPENRKRMEMEMMKDQKSYKSMLTFAKRTG